jgi:molybdopterin converting factor subunit 1
MITIHVRFFAGHRDIVGGRELELSQEEGVTVGRIWEQLTHTYPRLAGYSGRLLYAVNQEFATPATTLHDGDEVAFIPPVSGGRPAVREV